MFQLQKSEYCVGNKKYIWDNETIEEYGLYVFVGTGWIQSVREPVG